VKKFIILTLLISRLFAQNFVSPIWKMGDNEVNLLIGWERQGYFWQTERKIITNEFEIKNLKNDYELIINLRCTVHDILINGERVGGDIVNKFNWSDPADLKAEKRFAIPKNLLKNQNVIEISVSDFQYTGGKSYNYCRIEPKNLQSKSTIKFQFANDDHLYLDDNRLQFKIKYRSSSIGNINLRINSDFHEEIFQQDYKVDNTSGEITVDLSDKNIKPGIYECVAYLNDNGFCGEVQWFTLSPEKIQCTNTKPQGFDEYWEDALMDLKKVKPEFNMYKVDSLQSETRDGYIVEMKSLNGITIRGYYLVPKTEGPYPAILHLPGMGYGFQHHDVYLKNQEEVAELLLCVRNHGIADEEVPVWGMPGQWGTNICETKKYSYRGLNMDCVRALEFLESRPEIDNSRIGCDGGSQGGGLTLMLAGLCYDRLSAVAYFDPFPCDVKDVMGIRTIVRQELQRYLDYYSDCDWETAMRTVDIHDTKHFAEKIKCPVFFSAGLYDDDCPAHIGFAAYNTILSEKKYKVNPNDSHIGESNYNKAFMAYFKEVYGY